MLDYKLTRQDLFNAMITMAYAPIKLRNAVGQERIVEMQIRSITMEDGSGYSFLLDCSTRTGNHLKVYANTNRNRFTLIRG